MPLPPSPIGFDASVLINFCEVGELDLVVGTVPAPRFILRDVLEELESESCRTQTGDAIKRGDFLVAELDETELVRWASYTLRLDPGESATLAACVCRGWSVAVDERAARLLAAADLGAGRVTGTVGILRAAVEAGHVALDPANEILHRMIEAGYWSPVENLDDAG